MILPGFPTFSRSLLLGPELVTGGDFSSSVSWAVGAGWSISGGVATATPDASDGELLQASPVLLAPGMIVRASITVVSGSASGSIYYAIGGAGYVRFDGPGTYESDILLGTISSQDIGLAKSSIGGTTQFDNLSFRILG